MIIIIIGIITIIIVLIIIIINNLRMHQIICKAARTSHSDNSDQLESGYGWKNKIISCKSGHSLKNVWKSDKSWEPEKILKFERIWKFEKIWNLK